jgi:hypothetical protein
MEEDLNVLARRIRVVMIVDGAERAGLTPLHILHLHTLAFLTNVLAPVWQMPVLSGRLLKRRGGAFYPDLQRDVDRLVGEGVFEISGIAHVKDGEGRWRLEGCYSPLPSAGGVISAIDRFPQEALLLRFVRELDLAVSALSDGDLDRLFLEDATYSDHNIDYGNVIDFAEWRRLNFAANAAAELGASLPADIRSTPGERLHLYIRHLQKRLHVAG